MSNVKTAQIVLRPFHSLNKYGVPLIVFVISLITEATFFSFFLFISSFFKQSICKCSEEPQKKQWVKLSAFLFELVLHLFGLGEWEEYCLVWLSTSPFTVTGKDSTSEQRIHFIFFFCIFVYLFKKLKSKSVYFGVFEDFCCLSFSSDIAKVKCSKSFSSSKTLSCKTVEVHFDCFHFLNWSKRNIKIVLVKIR